MPLDIAGVYLGLLPDLRWRFAGFLPWDTAGFAMGRWCILPGGLLGIPGILLRLTLVPSGVLPWVHPSCIFIIAPMQPLGKMGQFIKNRPDSWQLRELHRHKSCDIMVMLGRFRNRRRFFVPPGSAQRKGPQPGGCGLWCRQKLLLWDENCGSQIDQQTAAPQAGEDDKSQPYQSGVNVEILADAGAYAAEHLSGFNPG